MRTARNKTRRFDNVDFSFGRVENSTNEPASEREREISPPLSKFCDQG